MCIVGNWWQPGLVGPKVLAALQNLGAPELGGSKPLAARSTRCHVVRGVPGLLTESICQAREKSHWRPQPRQRNQGPARLGAWVGERFGMERADADKEIKALRNDIAMPQARTGEKTEDAATASKKWISAHFMQGGRDLCLVSGAGRQHGFDAFRQASAAPRREASGASTQVIHK